MFSPNTLQTVLLRKAFFLCVFIIGLNYFCYGQPRISSFTPTSGLVGTTVTIAGSNFSSTPTNNIVYFGAVKATVSSASSNSLTVSVPPGATYKPITVTVNGLTAYSQNSFIVTFPISSNISSNSFAQSIDSTTDLHPNDLVMDDFDGDGKPDLATANNYSTTGSPASISILRNTSSGEISFAAHQDILTGVQTYAIAAGDLDGDGKPDIISSSLVDRTISVFRNTSVPGAISFAAKLDYKTGENPYGIAIGDLDGDGKPDIAVTNYVSGTISIFRNTGNFGALSFAPKADITTGADLGPLGIVIHDIDGDGKPDMVVTNNLSKTIAIFRNISTTGSISFAPSFNFYGGVAPMGMAIGDIDGDGKPDMVWAVNGDNTAFKVELNHSSPGVMAFQPTWVNSYNISSAYDVAISDLNGDGSPDLSVSSHGKISVFQNASTIGNVSFNWPIDFQGNSPYATLAGDVNNDGYADIITTNFTSTSLSIYKNQILQPSVTSFNPTISSHDSTVTITGNNFLGTTAVYFGDIPAKSFTVVNNTTVIAVVDSSLGGQVKVTNAYGSGSLAGFVFTGPPIIKSFTPISADSGVVVTLTGFNFIDVTGVSFGGTPASSFSVISPTVIKAVPGNGASGNIWAINNYGTGSIAGFVVAQPVISSFTPASAGRRDTVTLYGVNFSAVSDVSFGGISAASFSIISPTEIRAVVRGGSSGAVSVKTVRPVSQPGFTFILPPAPVISAVVPDSGRVGSLVTISGDHFSSALASNVIYFGATRANIVSASPSSLTVEVPAGTTYEPISMTNTETQLTAESSVFFNVTQPTIGSIDPNLFAPPIRFNYEPAQMLICDFNNDGKIDILGAASGTTFSIRKNTSTKKKISFENAFAPIGGMSDLTPHININAADIDGDGKKDLVELKEFTYYPYYISVFRNISTLDSIKFATEVEYQSYFVNTSASDLDKDGRIDVTTMYRNTSSGIGDITLENSSYSLSALVCEDFDGDGKPDIISSGNLVHVYCSQNTSTPGNISFGPTSSIYSSLARDQFISSISAGDIDGDGKNDLFVVNGGNSGGNFAILRNTSSGSNISFAFTDFPTDGIPNMGALCDMDGDGKPDLITSEFWTNYIAIYRNTSSPGRISFAPKQWYSNLTAHRNLAIGDFDGDSKSDIALCDGSGYLEILRNQMGELNILFNGATRFCEGGQLTLHSSFHSGNQWYKDGALIQGATSDSFVVKTGGTYTDIVTIGSTTVTADSPINITVIPKPAKPYINYISNDQLISSSMFGNQWFNDNGVIIGAIDSVYTPSVSSGNFRVQATVNGCASPLSDIYHYAKTDTSYPVRLFPNPVTDFLRIVFNIPNINSVTVSLYNLQGTILLENRNVRSGDQISLLGYPPGHYILRLIDERTNKVLSSQVVIKL